MKWSLAEIADVAMLVPGLIAVPNGCCRQRQRLKSIRRRRKQGSVAQLLQEVVELLEGIHRHGLEGTRYVLDMRYRFSSKEKEGDFSF